MVGPVEAFDESEDYSEDFSVEELENQADELEENKGKKEGNESAVLSEEGFSDEEKKDYTKEYLGLQAHEDWPEEGKILTIEEVKPQKVYEDDELKVSGKNRYYKKRLLIYFKESRMVKEDDKVLELKYMQSMPSVFYGVRKDKTLIPRIPKPCEEADLDDNFTSEAAKMRHLFLRKHPEYPRTQSDSEYVRVLKDKKMCMKKKTGKWKNSNSGKEEGFTKLIVDDFIDE